MQKIRAFTLMELLIGMIISSIVISFGYGSYTVIYKQFLSFKEIKKDIVEKMQLNTVINSDFMNAELVNYHDKKLTFTRIQSNPLEYEFEDSLIVRKDQDVKDTFKLTSENIISKPILMNETGDTAVINTFSFDANVLGEKEHFEFTKIYSAQTLMNYELLLKTKE